MKNTRRTHPTKGKRAQKRAWERATPAQIARQAGLILLVVAIWAGLLVVFLSLTGGDEAPVSEAPQPTEVVAAPATTQAPPSTEQPSTATHTVPAPTEAPEATSGPPPATARRRPAARLPPWPGSTSRTIVYLPE